MRMLPECVIQIIYSFLPPEYLTSTNRNNYLSSINIKRQCIKPYGFHSYVRDIIRRDSDFVFYSILDQYKTEWERDKRFRYKGTRYNNYIMYLKNYSEEIKSYRCNMILKELYNPDKKEHKKVHTKNRNGRLRFK